ncbi:hypothetical protein [Ramlibacter sp. PS4R-6]|uniref:hypothetical protein n=1 Tax=Ramlibacter sp. PS4R-6 TaxID=3133438 RepID=UPI0030958A17
MQKLFAFLAALACTAVLAAAPVPTIVVDAGHNQVVQREGAQAQGYVVAPAASLRLDARKFDFTHAGYPNLKPDAVHVVIKERQYFAPWPKSGLLELSRDTLAAVNDGPAFDGFRAGDSVEIGIGKKDVDHAKRSISFKVQWAAGVTVK